ncbi:DgyrCDS5183 [Dimorphilus gyrociliatus]|uniref:Alpha-1,3-mannosyl-glycoprotein 2-beta-N-acetylglucosaminyltransferase n=1 Tax=Dimorphilus gyrociliatus TaxID=2664684 RepID=A0A7I8VLS5_9ANNE|nr:DgyrCDS5183 [Dimorphilus gyrociliatus]
MLGSTVLDKLDFRDNFAMIGQRGLSHGTAIEQVEKGNSEVGTYGNIVTLFGCISVPMGQLLDLQKLYTAKPALPGSQIGETMSNCGVPKDCGKSAFAVHLYSGKGNEESPKICINGKYVFAKDLNDAGRGFNIAIVNPKTKSYSRIGRFDTYLQDSSNLEIFLEMLNEGDIILAVVNDDASRKLTETARRLFSDLGSAMIQNLKFRDSWIYIGQKGLDGFGETEQFCLEKVFVYLEFAGPNGKWPRVIDKRLCVSTKLKGTKIRPDPMSRKNEKRRKFCSKYDGYEDFCEGRIDEPLTPSPLTDGTMGNNPIFDIPIVVVPGLNQNTLRMQLETLLMQPGLRSNKVTVMYDEKFPEAGELAELFSFKTYKLTSSTKYSVQIQKALENIWILYSSAKHVIILEEEVIVSPDFLLFHSQLLPILEKDHTLVGTNSWNPNGFKGHSIANSLVTRSNFFPGYGFLLKRSYYEAFMQKNFEECCSKRSWNTWDIQAGYEVLVPDVSRVFRRPFDGLSQQANMLSEFLNRDRVTNIESKVTLKNTEILQRNAYIAYMKSRIKSATVLDIANSEDCLTGKGLGFYIPAKGGIYTIYFEQTSKHSHWILNQLCRCFGLFSVAGYNCPGLHENTLRFTQGGSEIILVGSNSIYYSLRGSSKAVHLI